MKYLIMIYSNPASRSAWDAMSDTEREEFGRAHVVLSDELAASGELVASEGLDDVSTAARLPATGMALSADGPFAEAKEYLAGFYLVECDSMDDAVRIAARVPDAHTNTVEVRQVIDLMTTGG